MTDDKEFPQRAGGGEGSVLPSADDDGRDAALEAQEALEARAEEEEEEEEKADEEELLTLTAVSERTGISMPTLQRYKKEFQDRIPSVGEGRTQRYPEEALPVFQQIKKENIKKRGRPKKSRTKAKAPDGTELLTLTAVGEKTGISYPTLVRYVKEHGDKIPYEGEGRKKRYYPEAVEVFQELRSRSGRGRKKKKASSSSDGGGKADGSLAKRVRSLERSQEKLEKQIKDLIGELKKPLTVTVQRK